MSLLQSFKDNVSKNNSVVIKFSTSTCGPCKVMAPMFDKLVSEYPDYHYMSVDLDTNEELATYIKSTYGITSVPVFIVLEEGQEVSRVVGAKPYSQLVQGLF